MRVGSAASPGRRLSPPWPSPPDDERLLIMNSGQTVSVYRFGFFYGQGRGGGRRGCLSDGWSMLKYIGVWVCGRLAVGGVPAPSVPVTWCPLAVVVPSAGGAVVRLVVPVGIGYVSG